MRSLDSPASRPRPHGRTPTWSSSPSASPTNPRRPTRTDPSPSPACTDPSPPRIRAHERARPACYGAPFREVADRDRGVFRLSTAPADRGDRDLRPSTATDNPAWSVPLLVTAEVEAWLLGWPAGLVTAAHDHGRATVGRHGGRGRSARSASTRPSGPPGGGPPGGPGPAPCSRQATCTCSAGDRPAVAVHAWSGPAGSAGRGAGGLALGRAAAGGRGPGRGRGPAEPVGVGRGRGGGGCLAGHPAHGALDLGHVGDRVAG